MNINTENRKIGQFILNLREERGMTQGQLAKALATSQSAVARMESGRQNFTTEMLAKLGEALNRGIVTLAGGAMNFEIEGGRKLHGTIEVRSSKNSAVALLCASLLNRGKTTLRDMPRIEEVNRIIEVLISIGVSVRWLNKTDLEIVPPRKLKLNKIDDEAARKTRSVIMLMGPLMHLASSFRLPYVGGCKLGKRTVQPHLYALEKMGLMTKTADGWYTCLAKPVNPGKIVMYESGNTPTENALMAAARIDGVVEIRRAASNYMVQDLCHFLEKLGVKVEGLSTHNLRIHGVPEINRDIEFWPSEDPIEAMTFMSIAATTNSPITIARCPIDFLDLELLKLEKMGMKFQIGPVYKAKNRLTNLVDIKCLSSAHLVALEDKLEAHDDPGMNMDNLPYFVPVAASAEGQTMIHDFMYENRAIYYLELNKLGADISLADVHRAYVNGPTKWKAGEVVCPPALRPAVLILIAMLAAKGKSRLYNVYSINRGYEDLANRLNQLGAKIKILRGV